VYRGAGGSVPSGSQVGSQRKLGHLSVWEAAEPNSQRVLHAQRTSFEGQFCDVSAGVGARGGPEKLIKIATDQLD
jgi:hypothetical protein